MKFEWKQPKEQYQTGQDLYCGRWNVGGIRWDGVTRGDRKYYAYLRLPGVITRSRTNFENENDAREWTERSVAYWFKSANEE